MKGTSIAGRKVKSTTDFYATPDYAVDKILSVANLEGTVLEPCSGNGAFAKKIKGCHASDIRTDEDVYGEGGVDIFSYEDKSYDVVITNPPYCICEQVIRKSLDIARKRVYMLCKLQFLEGAKREKFFNETPLKKVWVFRKRVNMYPANIPEEERPTNSGTIAYALYEWEHGYTGEPTIGWL